MLWEDTAGPPPAHAGGTEQGDREEPGTPFLPAILSPALIVLLIHKARRLSGWFPLWRSLKHQDKKTLCCPNSVTFGDWQAVSSGSSVLGTAPWAMSRSSQVGGLQFLLSVGRGPAGGTSTVDGS